MLLRNITMGVVYMTVLALLTVMTGCGSTASQLDPAGVSDATAYQITGSDLAAVDPFVAADASGQFMLDDAGINAAGLSPALQAFARYAIAQSCDASPRLGATSSRALLGSPNFTLINDGPAPALPRPTPFTTLAQTKAWLTANGYHQTPSYAATRAGWEYTKTVDYVGKPERLASQYRYAFRHDPRAYRYHAIIYASTQYTIALYGPEPNPEVLGYSAPAWWWISYAIWWHQRY